MRRFTIAILALLWAAAAVGAGEPRIGAGWARDPVWDDGLAEVAIYDARRVIYGAPREFQTVLIAVKEDLDARSLVKADAPLDGRELIPVIKLNAVREIPTPNYDYRLMTSLFVDRREPTRLVKLTSGCQEWCGNTWTEIRAIERGWSHEWSSYFDGEGRGRRDLVRAAGDLFADQLPISLRGMDFGPGVVIDFRLWPSFATNHAGPVDPVPVRAEVETREPVVVPAGRIDAWRVKIRSTSDGSLSLWFDAGGTHPLVRLESAAGDSLALRSIERRAYWKLSGR